MCGGKSAWGTPSPCSARILANPCSAACRGLDSSPSCCDDATLPNDSPPKWCDGPTRPSKLSSRALVITSSAAENRRLLRDLNRQVVGHRRAVDALDREADLPREDEVHLVLEAHLGAGRHE